MNETGHGRGGADQELSQERGDDYEVLVQMMSEDVALFLRGREEGFDARRSVRAVDSGRTDRDGLPIIAVVASSEAAPRDLWQRMTNGFNQGLLVVKPRGRTGQHTRGEATEVTLDVGELASAAAAEA